LANAGGRDRTVDPSTRNSLVSILVVTYNPNRESFRRCLDSVWAQSYADLELVVVDNRSQGDVVTATLQTLNRDHPRTLPSTLRGLRTNTGFARAMNTALDAATGSLCLLLNPDTELEPGAVDALVTCATKNPEVAGFAPKVKLLSYPDIIDSVGIEFSWNGDASQRGLGQPDLGQFDRSEPVPGVTMGATMIRRSAFANDRVGRLDERFFMFFEDVDWSMRAAIFGEQFLAVPDALVHHAGSESVQQRSFTWRYRLIERNVYFTAIKNYQGHHLAGFWLRRGKAHMRNVMNGNRPLVTVRILISASRALASLYADRRAIQSRRRRRDSEVINRRADLLRMDVETWRPLYSWGTVRDSVGRLFAVNGDERWSRAYRYLDLVVKFGLQLDTLEVLERLGEMAGPLPPSLQAYARQIERSGTQVTSTTGDGEPRIPEDKCDLV
jgi:GT2 family glycosyltransferase